MPFEDKEGCLNIGQKCRKPVFMLVSGICFIKWLWLGSICGESNDFRKSIYCFARLIRRKDDR